MSTEAWAHERPLQSMADGTMPGTVSIVDVHGIERMHEIEALQMAIWGSDPSWVVPSHLLYIVAENGGILLGAEVDGVLVGFVLGLLARQHGTLFHASHMLGIHPHFQQHGIGAELKLRQRTRALEQGLHLMTWTFDPLEARNAYFNLHKLGAVSRSYRKNYYGQMPDALNQGLPSDRLVVEWHLHERPAHLARVDIPTPMLVESAGRPYLEPVDAQETAAVAVAVPRNIQALKRDDPGLALEWRLQVREAFVWAESHGFVAVDFRDGAYILVSGEEKSR